MVLFPASILNYLLEYFKMYKSLLRSTALVLAMILPVYPAFSGDAPAITKLIKTDAKVGTGAEAVSGKKVSVHYTGWLYAPSKPGKKGTKFDSSVDRGEPFI